MREVDLRIERVPLSELVEYAGNAKLHPAEQVEQIAESMREFGNCDPIAVWTNAEGHLEIVEGHGRLMALRSLGADSAPVIHLDHLTDEQRRAYVHVHNQTTLTSGFDVAALQSEIDSLPGFDWDAFGFGDIDGIETGEAPEVEEFHEVESPLDAPTRCSFGDMWKLGEHVLMCGDSTDAGAVSMAMHGRAADMLLTDPPYSVGYTGKTKDALTIENDKWASDDDFREFLCAAFSNALEVMRPGAAFYIWYPSWQTLNFSNAAQDAGLTVRQKIVWNKSIFALGHSDYQWKHELCLYGWKDGAAHYFVNDRTLSTVWDYGEFNPEKASKKELQEFARAVLSAFDSDVWDFRKPGRNEFHPTMKPVPLMGKSIHNSTRRGDTVFDPFGGSGSTLLACEQSGLRCVTMDIDPKYCDVILDRWENETGKKAVRLNG